MRIAVTGRGPGVEDAVDPRFGRCAYLVMVDTETMETRALSNDAQHAAGGAGIQAASLVVDQRVDAVLTGNCGPKAFRVLQAAGVDVLVGVGGSISDAIAGYKAGRWRPAETANVASHTGSRNNDWNA